MNIFSNAVTAPENITTITNNTLLFLILLLLAWLYR